MKILFATNQTTALVHSGIKTQIFQLKESLEYIGIQVDLLNTWTNINPQDYDFVHIFSANIGTYHLARTLTIQNIPFIITPAFYTKQKIKTVKSITNLDILISRFVRGFWTDYGLIAEMCNMAKAVIVNSNAEQQLIKSVFKISDDKIYKVYTAAETRFANAQPDLFEREYGIKDFILSVNHIGPYRKNTLNLIKALETINHPAVIIGKIDNTQYGNQCVERAKRNPNLILIDELSHDSMLLASAYRACRVFALPSQFETPSISALEAGLAEANIVITPYGGTQEYFKNYAIYVEPSSVKEISDGIKKSLQSDKNNGLSMHLKQNHNWKKIADDMRSAYKNILGIK